MKKLIMAITILTLIVGCKGNKELSQSKVVKTNIDSVITTNEMTKAKISSPTKIFIEKIFFKI